MRLRTTVICGALLGRLALVPAAQAKGTMYLVGATNLVGSQSIAANGALSPIGTTPTGNTPRSGAITPDATKLFVSNFGGGNISAYTVGADGSLTPVSGSPFAADTNTEGLAVTPNGNFLYAANTGANNVTGYSITSSGALVPVGGSPFAVPNVKGVAASANGAFLFATTDAGVRVYAIDQTTGALSAVGGNTAAGTNPKGLAVTPDGRFLYVGNTGSNNLFGYSIGTDGSLSSLGSVPTGNVPFTVAVSADGRFVYVANSATDNVSAYAIGPNGTLAAVSGQPFAAGDEPYGVDAAPNARQVYVSNRVTNNVNAYDVAADGVLSQISGSPFAANVTNLEYQSIAITPNQGPTALFTGTVVGGGKRGGGQTAEFNATSSSDSDGGSVATYDWDFGDGSTLPNGGPTPTHVYANSGDYQVTLTVTDDEGCSTSVIFTGQTADCNGSAAARMMQTLQVGGGTAPNLELTGKKQKLRRTVKVKAEPADDTDAVAKGKLRIQNKKGKLALASFKLNKDRAELEADHRTKLKPRLSSKAYKKAKKALKKGGKVTAKVNVKATDADADTDKDSVKVRLTKP